MWRMAARATEVGCWEELVGLETAGGGSRKLNRRGSSSEGGGGLAAGWVCDRDGVR